MDFQPPQHLVHTLEVGQVDILHLRQVDVTGEALRSQIVDEALRVEATTGPQPVACSFNLMGIEFGCEAEYFLVVECRPFIANKDVHQTSVVARAVPRIEAEKLRVAKAWAI